MSEAPGKRRPPRLSIEPESVKEPMWCVRAKDGKVRGPLGIAGLRALINENLLTHDAEIASPDTADWHTIVGHPVWARLSTASRAPWARQGGPPPPISTDQRAPGAATPAPGRVATPRERQSEVQQREVRKLARAVRYWRFSRVLRGLREMLVFFVFIAAGDWVGSLPGASPGVGRWAALMSVMVVAIGYYALRVVGRR